MKRFLRILLALFIILVGLVACLVFIPIGGSSSIINEADSVRLYRINWDEYHPSPWASLVDEEGKLNSSRIPKDGVLLNLDDISEFKKADKTPLFEGALSAKCHYPHHAFAFYDKDQKMIASMTVCFMCSNVYSDNSKLDSQWNIDKLRKLIESKGVPVSNSDWD